MNLSLEQAITAVSQEKGVSPQVLREAVEQAILTAAKRQFGADRELTARFENGAVHLQMEMMVVQSISNPETEILLEDARRHGLDDDENPLEEGDYLGFQIFYLEQDAEEARKQDREYGKLLGIQQARQGFGRIAAQTAKQVILQRVRDAERERIFAEFQARKGELVRGTVRRFERGSNIIVDLDGTEASRTVEAILPQREQTPRESYRPGDRIQAYLKNIDREARGPQVVLSRTDVGLLVKLFETEVPEIFEGIVRIVAAAREPGARSKIAVTSRDNDVDPVGACVGMKGSRVQAVVQELRGEKIDIVPWDRDPARFVCNAIAPAEVVRVVIDDANKTMELVVPDTKLSLAIGRRGQNVRLASQLTGWTLDIVSESRFKQMEEEAIETLLMLNDEGVARSLYKMGFRHLDEVAEAASEELLTIDGITASNIDGFRSRAVSALEEIRLSNLKISAEQLELPMGKERLALIGGVSDRLAEALEKGGYASPESIASEEDIDRLAIRTELGAQRAAEIRTAAQHFIDNEWAPIEEGVAKAKEKAAEEAAIARAKAEKEAEERALQAAVEAEKARLVAEQDSPSEGDSAPVVE